MSSVDSAGSPYSEVIQLVKYWESFKNSLTNGNITDFGRWLSYNTAQTIHAKGRPATGSTGTSNLSKKAMAGAILGRMTLFIKNYTKAPFLEIGLGSMEEFKILSMIDRMKNPSKSMLSHASLMEFTTINDMLKRMLEKGWIKQIKDENDKRLTRVMLTESGEQFVRKAHATMSKLQPNLLGDLNEDEQNQLINLLIRLNNYHTSYFDKHHK